MPARRRVLGGRVAARLDELIRETAGERGWEIVALGVMPGQVHLFVKHDPTSSPSASVGAVSAATVGQYIDSQWEKV